MTRCCFQAKLSKDDKNKLDTIPSPIPHTKKKGTSNQKTSPFKGNSQVDFKDDQLKGKISPTTQPIHKEDEVKNHQINDLLNRKKVIWPDGTIWEGEFKNDQLHGQGKMIGADSVISGYFEENLLMGKGKIVYSNGHVEEGQFTSGSLHGQGKRKYHDGKIETGKFMTGQLIEGVITYPDGIREEGEFANGQLNGRGTRKYRNGKRETGSFMCGQLMRT